jgi:Photosynthesis system II assembly factor YCF48
MGPVSPLAGEGQADLKQRGHSGANANGVAGFAKDSMAAPAAGLVLNLRARPGASNGASRSSATESSPTESERARENVTIEAASSEATTLPNADSNQIARAEWPDLNSAPEIIKAKPALDTSSANTPQGDVMQKSESPSTFFARGPAHVAGGSKIASHDTIAQVPAAPIIAKQPASWMVADGALKRSVDGGQTWQATTSTDRPVLCYSVRGRDVWAGGQAGMLLRSTDNGTTWSAVAVSFHGQPLSSAVTRIDTSAPAEIVLSTDNHETWSSLDAGKTWTKK